MATDDHTHSAPLPLNPATPYDLKRLSQQALAELAQRQPELCPPLAARPAWCERAVAILAANLAAGRFTAARAYQPAGADDTAALTSYARQILVELLRESARLAELQAGATAAWTAVLDRLERLAFTWLGPHGREAWAAWEARDAAAATCADLWHWLQTHPYPFDVPFDRWATRALVNRLHGAARQRQRRAGRVTEIPLDVAAFREADETASDLLYDAAAEARLEDVLARQTVLPLLRRLPCTQAAVVRLWYLAGWRADEIAAHLGQSVGNVYVLRHRGLARLRTLAATPAPPTERRGPSAAGRGAALTLSERRRSGFETRRLNLRRPAGPVIVSA